MSRESKINENEFGYLEEDKQGKSWIDGSSFLGRSVVPHFSDVCGQMGING